MVLGVIVLSARSEYHEHDGFSSFPEMHPKSYYSKMKRNNSTEILGSFRIYAQRPQTPNPHFPKICWISQRKPLTASDFYDLLRYCAILEMSFSRGLGGELLLVFRY